MTKVMRRGMTLRDFFEEAARSNVPGLPYVNHENKIVGRISVRDVYKHIAVPDAMLGQQDLSVLCRVGKKGHRHHEGLGAGLRCQPMHDVMWVCGVVAGKSAEERDEPDIAGVHARQVVNGRRQSSAVTDTDHTALTCFDFTP